MVFDVSIKAKDAEDAMHKLLDYLVELKRDFTVERLPLQACRDPGIVARELIRRLRQITDPVAFIVTLHVFCEYWINWILQTCFPARDLTRWDFYKKLQVVYITDKIPKQLFENLSRLNDLRTQVAHNPDYDLTKMDLNYHCPDRQFALIGFKPSYAPTAKQHHVFNVLNGVMCVTYLLLHNHCVDKLGLKGSTIVTRDVLL